MSGISPILIAATGMSSKRSNLVFQQLGWGKTPGERLLCSGPSGGHCTGCPASHCDNGFAIRLNTGAAGWVVAGNCEYYRNCHIDYFTRVKEKSAFYPTWCI